MLPRRPMLSTQTGSILRGHNVLHINYLKHSKNRDRKRVSRAKQTEIINKDNICTNRSDTDNSNTTRGNDCEDQASTEIQTHMSKK